MKTLSIVVLLLFVAAPVFAADQKDQKLESPKITCGKTVEECQKQVDDLTNRLAQTTIAYQTVRKQRDAIAQQANDSQIDTAIQQATAAAAAQKK